ncbi:MAG: hypothetical protein NXI12_15400 [Alphaproteobacteria bacterium]|nr:hypothetical protein [Alphaproteobacteria bacterium]
MKERLGEDTEIQEALADAVLEAEGLGLDAEDEGEKLQFVAGFAEESVDYDVDLADFARRDPGSDGEQLAEAADGYYAWYSTSTSAWAARGAALK